MTERRRDAWTIFAVALFVRAMVVGWARGRFPPTGDGYYYDVLAHRLASGHGYTWLWPDGAVTYAAHYPVGFPALLAIGYVFLGASDTVAMSLAGALGAASAYASHRIVDQCDGPRWRPIAAGLAVALHPALVPYTAARMTEGVTASLLVLAVAVAGYSRSTKSRLPLFVMGVLMAVATLVRPQSLLMAPVLGALSVQAGSSLGRRAASAAAVTAVALACVSPWSARNCMKMSRCALVSLNGGWNLLIGATTTTGGWQPVSVPPECASVWDEAEKDECFERAAVRTILRNPVQWLARAPSKVAMTLDYFGAGPWYLHASNEEAFGQRAKATLAALETFASRALLLGALWACGRAAGPRKAGRWVASGLGAVAAVSLHGSLGYLALVCGVGLLGWQAIARLPVIVPACAAAILATAAVHATFFGSGRYGLIVAPFVAIMAFVGLGPKGDSRAVLAHGGPLGASCEPSTPLG